MHPENDDAPTEGGGRGTPHSDSDPTLTGGSDLAALLQSWAPAPGDDVLALSGPFRGAFGSVVAFTECGLATPCECTVTVRGVLPGRDSVDTFTANKLACAPVDEVTAAALWASVLRCPHGWAWKPGDPTPGGGR